MAMNLSVKSEDGFDEDGLTLDLSMRTSDGKLNGGQRPTVLVTPQFGKLPEEEKMLSPVPQEEPMDFSTRSPSPPPQQLHQLPLEAFEGTNQLHMQENAVESAMESTMENFTTIDR